MSCLGTSFQIELVLCRLIVERMMEKERIGMWERWTYVFHLPLRLTRAAPLCQMEGVVDT